MHSCVRGGIININGSVFIGYPPISEQYVRYIAYAFFSHRCHKISTRLGNNLRGVLKRCHVEIKHIAQAGRTTANAMCQMQPSLWSFDGVGALTVFCLLDGVGARSPRPCLWWVMQRAGKPRPYSVNPISNFHFHFPL